jgi:glycosyl hydrolase family 42 (putative beta-galactosidase)
MNFRRIFTLTCLSMMTLWAKPVALAAFLTIRDGYLYDPATAHGWIPRGIAYQTWNRPLGVWQSWDQINYDLDEMAKMGANCVRVDFVWQHIEPEKDRFDWNNYDYLVSACSKRGLRLLPLIGYQWPPQWFPEELYTMHPPSYDSADVLHTNRWLSDIIAYENPEARRQYGEFISAVCGRYRNEPAIVAWVIGNEYGYLGLWSGLLDGYDQWSESAFRKWCRERFGSIAEANLRWGSHYLDFDSIPLLENYRHYGVEGAQWADMIQWREDSIAEFVALGAAAARAADTNHLLSYSTVGMQWGEDDWRYHAEDRGKIARACASKGASLGFFSINNYPWGILGHESMNGQWGVSFTKKVTGLPVLYSETGFTSSETLWPGMDEYHQGILTRNSIWEGFIAGSIGTHVFTWQDRPYITPREAGFGLLYGDRRVKQSFWTVRDTFTTMQQVRLPELLAGSQDPAPDIAFLWTGANDSQYNRYEAEMQQIAGTLERLGFEPNFIDLDDLAQGAFQNYRVLILPRNLRMDEHFPGTDKGVLEFIRTNVLSRGIHVVAGADLPGAQDENGKPLSAFKRELDLIFGVDPIGVSAYEVPPRWGAFTYDFWHRIKVSFLTNAPNSLKEFVYEPWVWKFNEGVGVTDGTICADMDSRQNRGFEDSATTLTESWISSGEVLVRSNTGWQMDGTNAVEMRGEAAIYQEFPAVPGGRYGFSAHLRMNANDALTDGKRAFVGIEWYGRDGSLIQEAHSEEFNRLTTANQWHRYFVDTTGPNGVCRGRKIVRLTGNGLGSILVDNAHKVPALVTKDHGMAKAALFTYAPGDHWPSADNRGTMDGRPWFWRSKVWGALLTDYFGVQPRFQVQGTNGYLCLADYRSLTNGSTLWQVKNYAYDLSRPNGGSPQEFAISSSLFRGATVEALLSGRVLERLSDGTIRVELPPHGSEVLWVYDPGNTGASNTPTCLVRILDSPSSVHPFGDKSYAVRVRYDCGQFNNAILHLGFAEDGDNGDGASNEIYQALANPVTGAGEHLFYIWIPDFDLGDSDYKSASQGGRYVFRAWMSDSGDNKLSEAVPMPVQLQWGVSPVSRLPGVVNLGSQAQLRFKWEDLPETLWWETTPVRRNETFPARVAVFRSSKTKDLFPTHSSTVNGVADWLESLGYTTANPLDVSFDDLRVEGLLNEDFSDGETERWQREAGAANWTITEGALRVWRAGNDDNLMVTGDPNWRDYTVSTRVRYNKMGPYFNDIELYFNYQNRDNFHKIALHNFYGSWRVKSTVRLGRREIAKWIFEFPKFAPPKENTWYEVKVEIRGSEFTVLLDGNKIGSFSESRLRSGRVGLGVRAGQLGIWEPERAYYFIDDDEYTYYSTNGAPSTIGNKRWSVNDCSNPEDPGNDFGPQGRSLELSDGYLTTFFPTLILPAVRVMSDAEVSNVTKWLHSGLHSLILSDGPVGIVNERGEPASERLASVLGVHPEIDSPSNSSRMTILTKDHYITHDFPIGYELGVKAAAYVYRGVSTGSVLSEIYMGTERLPGIIVSRPPDANTNAPPKVVTLNLEGANLIEGGLGLLAKRVFEWSRNEPYKLKVELKNSIDPSNPAFDPTVAAQDVWILNGNGEADIGFDVPEAGISTGSNYYWVAYAYPGDSTNPFGDHRGFYTSGNDGEFGRVTVDSPSGETFVVFSDLGIPLNAEVFTWMWPPLTGARFEGQQPDQTAPEGTESFQTEVVGSWGGWGVFKHLDMSRFSNGFLRFWLQSTQSLKFDLEGPPGRKHTVFIDSTGGAWKQITLPLSTFSNVELREIFGLFLLTAERRGTYYVDDVRWLQRLPDLDNDGMCDDWEFRVFGSLDRDGSGDADGDGQTDYQEFMADTSPVDARDLLHMQIALDPGGDLILRVRSGGAAQLWLHAVELLDSSVWATIGEFVPDTAEGWQKITVPQGSDSHRFFKVVARRRC